MGLSLSLAPFSVSRAHKGPHVKCLELHPWVRAESQVAKWEMRKSQVWYLR